MTRIKMDTQENEVSIPEINSIELASHYEPVAFN
jgi:hypothetical protein